MRYFLTSVALLAVLLIGSTAFAQSPHSLQLNATGATPTILIGSTPGGTYTFPSGSGTVVVDNGTGVSTAWLLTGNSGTNAATNFLGTTGATDVVFKTNSVEKIRLVDGAVGKLTSPTAELILEETGDFVGAARLHLQNRIGSNGVLSENSAVDVADYGLKTKNGNQGNLRRENRLGYVRNFASNPTGEFQLVEDATGGTPIYTLVIAKTKSFLEVGNFGIGNTNPLYKLDVTGTLGVSGVLTASTGASGIVFGTGANATTLTSTATVARAISFPDGAGTVAVGSRGRVAAVAAATQTINNAAVTANCIIIVTIEGATQATFVVNARVAGASFNVVTNVALLATDFINYQIIVP